MADGGKSYGDMNDVQDASGALPALIYENRFDHVIKFRQEMWQILCQDYFQQFIPSDSQVLEIAAGYCEFINQIRAKRKFAVDINPATVQHANDDVEVYITLSSDLTAIPLQQEIDIIFISNFLEHITKPEITATMQECLRTLGPGGKLILLQPNIRYAFRDYWMFYDHITAIDDRAICELLTTLGYEIVIQYPRFLPYTTKGKLPPSLVLLRLYLRLPFLWKIFGGQALIIAKKAADLDQ